MEQAIGKAWSDPNTIDNFSNSWKQMLAPNQAEYPSSVSRNETKSKLLKHVTTSPGTWPDIIQKCRLQWGKKNGIVVYLHARVHEVSG